jgi:hypothetical protein
MSKLMPISTDSIERFLEYTGGRVPWSPKGKSVDELLERIEQLSGAPYEPKTVPRPVQLESLAFSLDVPHCLIFMKMRLGKSKLSLDWATQLRRGGRWQKGKALIVTPRPIVSDVWESEIAKHSDLKFRLVRNDINELYAAIDSDCDIVVAALTGLQRMLCPLTFNKRKKRNARAVDFSLARELAKQFEIGIVDEIHKCSNPTTVSFKITAALTQDCRYFMGLTGTPHGRDPFKIWAQAFLADRGETFSDSYHFFQHAFGKKKKDYWSPSGFKVVFDQSKMPALERKLDRIAISYGWDGNIEMPAVQRNQVDLKLSDEQHKYYYEAIDKVIKSKTGEQIQIDAIFTRLRQISSGFLPYTNDNGEERVQFFKTASKLEWIEEFLEEAPREAKIVIFHDFIATGQLICNHLKLIKVPHLWLYGGTKDKTGTVKKFQTSTKDNILVTNPSVSELALDFSAADYMCFFESPVSPIVREQAEARPMSPFRKDRPLIIDDLVCSPVERRILKFIKEGKTLLAGIVYRELLETGGLL